jgi:hypothetical protein
MPERDSNNGETIDHATAAAICKGVGEKLRQNLAPERSDLPSRLRDLLDRMRSQDDRSGR